MVQKALGRGKRRTRAAGLGMMLHQDASIHLGIEMIPAYSSEARGRSKRMFRTH